MAGSADDPEVSMQAGSGSKDAWVLAELSRRVDVPVEPNDKTCRLRERRILL